MSMDKIADLAHEAWALAQLAPGEGVEDGVRRVGGLIAAALDDARREGAEQMREAAAALCKSKADREGARAMDAEDDEPDMVDSLKATAWDFMVMESTIRALPLPTGQRQAVRLTDSAVRQLADATLYSGSIYDRVRAIESAVLAANGLEGGAA